MNKYAIVLYSDYGNTIVKKVYFYGTYQDARKKANILLYSDDRYVSFNVELE